MNDIPCKDRVYFKKSKQLYTRTGNIIKLQQYFILHQEAVRGAVADLHDSFEIFFLVAMFEPTTQDFESHFFDEGFGFGCFGFLAVVLLYLLVCYSKSP
jgi:hypothetical protein